ncbi:transposable element Tcb1 transposase [Trichonephila clavipes]|nr:transposable element Tcb1 transposase [Trichonephila clavipes]
MPNDREEKANGSRTIGRLSSRASQTLSYFYPADRKVTVASPKPIFGFKLHRKRGNKMNGKIVISVRLLVIEIELVFLRNADMLSMNYHKHIEEEYVRALKAFQYNNRIVMAQRKHLDDFLRGTIFGRLECGRTQLEVSEELGIVQSVISRLWQRFHYDGNVSRCYSTGHPRVTTPNQDRYVAVTAKQQT